MTPFQWNINFFIFWRLAWMYRTNYPHHIPLWRHCGHLYISRQPDVRRHLAHTKLGKKIKSLLAK